MKSVWNLKGHIFFYYYYYYKNCVHCVYVTAVCRTVEGGRKSVRFKCKLRTFILSVSKQWSQKWHKVNMATCILVVTLVTVALVSPQFIFIWNNKHRSFSNTVSFCCVWIPCSVSLTNTDLSSCLSQILWFHVNYVPKRCRYLMWGACVREEI